MKGNYNNCTDKISKEDTWVKIRVSLLIFFLKPVILITKNRPYILILHFDITRFHFLEFRRRKRFENILTTSLWCMMYDLFTAQHELC